MAMLDPESEAEAEGELHLPEQEFTYLAGSTDRPWAHFTGRWRAMKPRLSQMLLSCGSEQPLRIVDLGSCTGFFSLQAAFHHPEADIVAVEGSVGIGNGTVGMAGTLRQILRTEAVQTHLRWIDRLQLPNCFVAPEVWDYARVRELAALGRPVCDAMFLLSVVHHIDTISVHQYESAGLSHLDGFIDLLGKLLLLSPRHFIELPNRPWLANAYDAYGTARGILEAAVAASGRQWTFTGPIFTAEWFGLRELWVLEAAEPMPRVDVRKCPFPALYRGQEDDLDDPVEEAYGRFDLPAGAGAALGVDDALLLDSAAGGVGIGDPLGIDHAVGIAAEPMSDDLRLLHAGSLINPALMVLASQPCAPVEDRIVRALQSAPTSLLVAHLSLREAISEAQDLLQQLQSQGLLEDLQGDALARSADLGLGGLAKDIPGVALSALQQPLVA